MSTLRPLALLFVPLLALGCTERLGEPFDDVYAEDDLEDENFDDEQGNDEDGDDGVPASDPNPGPDPDPDPDPDPECLPADQPFVGTASLLSNADVEALAGVSVIEGNLGIHWEVTDISALSCLREVTGGLWIVETQVASVDPLQGLLEVGGELEIGMAPNLVDVTLPVLEQVGYLSVYQNESLTNLELPALHTIGLHAEIDDNPLLPTCDVTTIRDALSSLGGEFYYSGNLADGC
jgi:hypothetical protein